MQVQIETRDPRSAEYRDLAEHRVRFVMRRLAWMGAAANWLVVNMAAALAPASMRSSAMSGAPLDLMPALTLAAVKPRGQSGAVVMAGAVSMAVMIHSPC
jgi:hypothetical protein